MTVLIRRWRIVLAGTVTGIAIGTLVLVFIPAKFRYTSVIEIARIATDPSAQAEAPIETPESTVTKLEGAIIPSELRALVEQYPDRPSLRIIRLKADTPKDGNAVIALESTGPLGDEDIHIRLHTNVVTALAKNHQRPWELAHNNLGNAQVSIRLRKEDLVDQMRVLTRQEELLAQSRRLVDEQIKEVRQVIADTEARRPAAATVTDQGQALALMLVDNAQQQNRLRLAGLEERLSVDLVRQADELTKAKADNGRKQNELDSDAIRIRLRVESLAQTRSLLTAQRSLRPVGLSPESFFVLITLAGIAAGIGLALMRTPANATLRDA